MGSFLKYRIPPKIDILSEILIPTMLK